MCSRWCALTAGVRALIWCVYVCVCVCMCVYKVHVEIGLPDEGGRTQILNIHTKVGTLRIDIHVCVCVCVGACVVGAFLAYLCCVWVY